MPNGRRERSAPACAAPHGLQQTSKVPVVLTQRQQQQKCWPAQKLRLEVVERRGSEAGEGCAALRPDLKGAVGGFEGEAGIFLRLRK